MPPKLPIPVCRLRHGRSGKVWHILDALINQSLYARAHKDFSAAGFEVAGAGGIAVRSQQNFAGTEKSACKIVSFQRVRRRVLAAY